MNIKTLILDDDINSRLAAHTALSSHSDIDIREEFSKSSELFAFLERETADLLILDIELEGENGFDIAKKLREEYPRVMVVFLTGHSSYAIDGYDFHPINFLTKPINTEKLGQTILEIRRKMNETNEQSSARLMFRLQQGYKIIDVKDIQYIERLRRKNYLYTQKETLRIMNYTMHELEEMLSKYDFFLCHQSFLISLYRVTSVRDVGKQLYEVTLKDCERPVPVSRNRYEELIKRLKKIDIQAV